MSMKNIQNEVVLSVEGFGQLPVVAINHPRYLWGWGFIVSEIPDNQLIVSFLYQAVGAGGASKYIDHKIDAMHDE